MNVTLLDEAKRLSVEERLELVTAIWDTLPEEVGVDTLPLSEAHQRELERRLSDLRENPTAESDWSEVEKRLRDR